MPETTDYMVLGFAVTIVLLLATLAYFAIKARNQQAELKLLETIEQAGEAPKESADVRSPVPLK
jgi:hypothetical protein